MSQLTPKVAVHALALFVVAGTACTMDATPEEQFELATTSAALTMDEQIAKSTCGTDSTVLAGLSNQILAEIANCLKPGVLVPVSGAGIAFHPAVNRYMVKAAADALKAAAASRPGDTLNVSSMFRTVAEQYFFYRRSGCFPAVAPPGDSNHETGIAVDISDPDNSTYRSTLSAHGFRWLGSHDRFHFDYVGSGAINLRGQDVLAFQRLWNRNNPGDKIGEDGGWGPQTEARMRRSPVGGFPIGACGTAPPPPVVTPWPKLEVVAETVDPKNRFTDGTSAAIADVMEGDEYAVNLVIRNTGDAVATNVVLGVWIEAPFVSAKHYVIESDWNHPGTFEVNDADARTDNPKHDEPGATFELKINNLSPKETKRVRLKMSAAQYSIGAADSPDVRFWVRDVPGVYSKTDFFAAPVNVEKRQTFGGGDLLAWAAVDVYSRTRWSFDGKLLEGWTGENGAELTVADKEKGLVIASPTSGPRALSPETTFDAAAFPRLEIRATNASGASSRVYFATSDAPSFDEARAIDFVIPAGDKQTVVVDLSQNAAWKGTITRLRIDPAGSLEIDDVRLVTGTPPGSPGQPGDAEATDGGVTPKVEEGDGSALKGSCGLGASGRRATTGASFLLLAAAICAVRRRGKRGRDA